MHARPAQHDVRPDESISVFIARRMTLEPPKELLDDPALWPEVERMLEEELEKLKRGNGQGSWSLMGYLTHCKIIRRCFVRDCVFLKRTDPEHPLWKHRFFHTELFKKWEQELIDHVNRAIKGKSLAKVSRALESRLTQN